MSDSKTRDDEIYENGVRDGERADLSDQFMHSLVKGYSFNPRETEIYNKGYAYGVSQRPELDRRRREAESRASLARDEEERAEQRQRRVQSQSNDGNSSGSEAIGKLIAYIVVAIAVIWLVFSVAIPLAVINIALIALLGGKVRKEWRGFLFPISVCGAFLVVADYNEGWFTAKLVNSLSFFGGLIPVFLYVNIAAGLCAAYFLIRDFLDGRSAPPESEGEFSRRNMIVMGGLLLVGGTTVAVQSRVDSGKLHRPLVIPAPTSGSGTVPTTGAAAHGGSAFLGKWNGYYVNCIAAQDPSAAPPCNVEDDISYSTQITEAGGRYTIRSIILGNTGSPFVVTASLRAGKLIGTSPGVEDPGTATLELLPDGSVKYVSSGAGEVRLKRAAAESGATISSGDRTGDVAKAGPTSKFVGIWRVKQGLVDQNKEFRFIGDQENAFRISESSSGAFRLDRGLYDASGVARFYDMPDGSPNFMSVYLHIANGKLEGTSNSTGIQLRVTIEVGADGELFVREGDFRWFKGPRAR